MSLSIKKHIRIRDRYRLQVRCYVIVMCFSILDGQEKELKRSRFNHSNELSKRCKESISSAQL